MSQSAFSPGNAIHGATEATKAVCALQEAPEDLDETRYGSLPQDHGHRYLEVVSEGYATPTPPYSAWPIEQQEAIRLANQQPLPKAMIRPVISSAASSGNVTSSDESAFQVASDRLVRAARRKRVLGKAGHNKQLADSLQLNAPAFQEILTQIARLETTLSDKIDTAQSLTPRPTSGGTIDPASKHLLEYCQVQTPDVIQKTSGQWNSLPLSSKVADAIAPVMLIALGIFCTKNDIRLLFDVLVRKHGIDPWPAAMCALILLFVGKLAVTIPEKLFLLSGDYLHFEDALGTSIKVPSSTYSHIKIFRAFLEVHFEGKPGLEKVLNGEYTLLRINGSLEDEIHQNEWSGAVRRGSRIVMSMLLGAYSLVCLECFVPLSETEQREIFECSGCKHKYRRARGDGRYLPPDIFSRSGTGSAISSTAIALLDSMTDGDIKAGFKDNKNIDEKRKRTKPNTRSKLRSRSALRFRHISLIMTNDSSTYPFEDTLYSKLRREIEDCEKHHLTCIQHRFSDDLGPKYLLDCLTRRIVRTEGSERYACLSYVWGGRAIVESDYSFPILSKVPKTIEDAISVVKRLRLRYLWIDRYCINHSDVIERRDEIKKMSNIFMGAVVTVIAPGPHDDYGLPGFSRRLRPSHNMRLSGEGEVTLTSHASTWQTRAWSTQESLCTCRVLFFEDGPFFMCKREMELGYKLENQLDLNTDDEAPRPPALVT